MRCLGVNKYRKRCGLNGDPFFCHHHKWQPIVFCFTLLSIAGVIGGVYQDIVLPVNSFFRKEEVTERQIKKTFRSASGYTAGKGEAHVVALVDCITTFSEYLKGSSIEIHEEKEKVKEYDDKGISQIKTNFYKASRMTTLMDWEGIIHVVAIEDIKEDFHKKKQYRNKRLRWFKKVNILITPPLEEKRDTAISLEITNYIDTNNDSYYIYITDTSFTYSDLERYANKVGIVVVSSRESYDKKFGYKYDKSCEVRKEGIPFGIYQDGIVLPIKDASQ